MIEAPIIVTFYDSRDTEMTIKREQVFIRDYCIVAAPFEIDGAPLMVDGYVADPALWQPLVERAGIKKSMSRHFASIVRMWRC
jgi:hypothetical protein